MLAQLPGPIRTLESTQELLEERHRKNASDEVIRLVQWLMRNTSNTVCVLCLLGVGVLKSDCF